MRIYEALKGRVPLQAYFHQGGHGGAPPLEMMNKWFTRYLYGVQNGVEKDPEGVDRARSATGAPASAWRRSRPRPAAGEAAARRRRRRRTRTIRIPAAQPVVAASSRRRRRDRRPRARGHRKAGIGKARSTTSSSPARRSRRRSSRRNRLAVRDAGARRTACTCPATSRVTIRLASSKPAANLSVWLVVLPWTDGPISPANLITRGWADPQNHAALKERRRLPLDARAASRSRRAGSTRVTFDLAARRSDRSGRQADRLDDLLERPRFHAVAQARHRAHDRSRRDLGAIAGGWRTGAFETSLRSEIDKADREAGPILLPCGKRRAGGRRNTLHPSRNRCSGGARPRCRATAHRHAAPAPAARSRPTRGRRSFRRCVSRPETR